MRLRVVVACVVCGMLGFGTAVVTKPWSAHAAQPDGGTGAAAAIFSVNTTKPLVALTFDDGPDPRWTPQVLDLLHRAGDSATFFDTGLNATAHPELVRAEAGGGNEVGDHTWSHRDLRTLPTSSVEAEVVKGSEAIQAAGAPRPQWFRPPYGSTDDAVSVVAAAEGYRTVRWDLAVEHYLNHTRDTGEAIQDLLSKVRPGSIILAHDGGVPDRTRTMQALPRLLDGLKARGYRVIDVASLVAAGGGSHA